MGILDDAIREHLELKRAHGAAEDEVRQKEAEAFGPVRHDMAPAEPPADDATQLLSPEEAEAPVAAEAVEEPAALEPALPAPEDPYAVHPGDHPVPDPHDHAHPAGGDPAWAEDTEVFTEEPAEPAAAAGAGMLEPSHVDPGPPPTEHGSGHDEPHPALHDHDAIHAEEHPPEPAFPHEPARPAEPDTHEQPTVAHEPARPVAADDPDAEADEDVLEETPEFLQDAPEHDRLWFEQKPPRDFDFGE
jgi:hypothetical protein